MTTRNRLNDLNKERRQLAPLDSETEWSFLFVRSSEIKQQTRILWEQMQLQERCRA